MKIAICALFVLIGAFYLSGCGDSSTSKPVATAQSDGYPLKTCPVSGEELGKMGEPYVIKYQGKTVKLCCSSCIKEFNSDPAKYMSILEEAQKKSASPK